MLEGAGSNKAVSGLPGALVVDMLVVVDDLLLSLLDVVLLDKALFERFTYLSGHSDVQGSSRADTLDFIEYTRMLQYLELIEDDDKSASHEAKVFVSERRRSRHSSSSSSVVSSADTISAAPPHGWSRSINV